MTQGSSSDVSAPPPDVLQQQRTGNAIVSSFQSTGIDDAPGGRQIGNPSTADALAVFESQQKLTAAQLESHMDALQSRAEAGKHFETGTLDGQASTAAIAHLQDDGGPGKFKLVSGQLSDSQVMIARVDASGQVTSLTRADGVSPTPFGDGHMMNGVGQQSIELAKGERAFVIAASDGLADGHIMLAARKDVWPEGAAPKWQDLLKSDIEAGLRADPSGNKLSSHLAASAAAYGARDNVTISSVALGADTHLAGKSLTVAVFDGTGHADGRFSNHLANDFQQMMGGQAPEVVQRQHMGHMVDRPADMAAAVKTNQAHFEANHAPKPAAPEAAPTKADAPKADAPKVDAHKPDTPKAEAHKPADTKASDPAKPVKAAVKTAAKVNAAAGRMQSGADAAVKLASGDVAGATVSAGTAVGMEAIQSQKGAELAAKAGKAVVEAGEKSGGKIASALGVAKLVGKRIPGIGAIVTAGFGIAAVGSLIIAGEYKKAGVEAVASAAEAGGNIAGFGIGDGLRETVRGTAIAVGGKEYEVAKSGLRELGESAVDIVATAAGPKEPKATYTPPPQSNVAPTRTFNAQAKLPADMIQAPAPMEPGRRPSISAGNNFG